MLSSIFEQFVQESPISVMARVLMERVFAPERIDKLFDTHAIVQYQQDLLFSSQVDLTRKNSGVRMNSWLLTPEFFLVKSTRRD